MAASHSSSEGPEAAAAKASPSSRRNAPPGPTGHFSAPAPFCSTATRLSKDAGRCRSRRWCCPPSQKPCASRPTTKASRSQAERARGAPLPPPAGPGGASRWNARVSAHAGITTKNDMGPAAAASRASILSTMASITSGTNGGFASKLPSRRSRSKKLPREPKGASVSGKAEQKCAK